MMMIRRCGLCRESEEKSQKKTKRKTCTMHMRWEKKSGAHHACMHMHMHHQGHLNTWSDSYKYHVEAKEYSWQGMTQGCGVKSTCLRSFSFKHRADTYMTESRCVMVTRRLAAQKFHKNPWGLENFCAFFHPAPPSEIFLHNDLYEDFFLFCSVMVQVSCS